MVTQLSDMIRAAMAAATEAGALTIDAPPAVVLESPKQAAHGDVACPIALGLAKQAKRAPRQIAEILVKHLPDASGLVDKVEIAGPGFLNFYLTPGYWCAQLVDVLDQDTAYGTHTWGEDCPTLVEFVSANPTGPLHVGHGRGAVVGDASARLLEAVGTPVKREYYVNNVGNQMNILGRSTHVRYRQIQDPNVTWPDDHYRGEYIKDIAQDIFDQDGAKWTDLAEADWLPHFSKFAYETILEEIRTELDRFDIRFDQWFSERRLYEDDAEINVLNVIAGLEAHGAAYIKDDATWLETTRHGDDKDRVMVRSNGVTTYFASDVAYHKEKFSRGFKRLIDVWGADHHGYIGRMKAAVTMLDRQPDDLTVVLVQLVSLLRNGEPVAMSTRAGEFVTLEEVVKEIGTDATRFYFLTRKSDAHLEFDLEVAKAKTSDNPVYYIQYAHARVHQLFAKAREAGIDMFDAEGRYTGAEMVDLSPLHDAETVALIKQLTSYPEVVDGAARDLAVHKLPYYLQELASKFHGYYYKNRFVSTDDIPLTQARLVLAAAVGRVIKNGLGLLGVSAPTRM